MLNRIEQLLVINSTTFDRSLYIYHYSKYSGRVDLNTTCGIDSDTFDRTVLTVSTVNAIVSTVQQFVYHSCFIVEPV